MPTPNYSWQKITLDAAFAPRDGAGALTYKNKMYLIGGWNPSDKTHFPKICSNDVWTSTDGQSWACIKPNTFGTPKFDPKNDWEGRHTAGYVLHQDRMWIVGGDGNQGHYHNDVWSSADGVAWRRESADAGVPWHPRALHYTVAYKNKLWVIGGQTIPQFAPAEQFYYDDIWVSENGKDWQNIKPQGKRWPQRGMIGGTAIFHDRIWLLGGGTYDTPSIPSRKFFNDVWSTDDGFHWTCHTEKAAWHPRQYHDVAVWDDRLWVLEGWNQSNRNDVWHSADGVNWTELPGTPWKPRHAASVFVHDNALWMVAGNNMESDAWKLVKS